MNVKFLNYETNYDCKDVASCGGKLYNVDVYHIELYNGKRGTLRVIKKCTTKTSSGVKVTDYGQASYKFLKLLKD